MRLGQVLCEPTEYKYIDVSQIGTGVLERFYQCQQRKVMT